MIKVVIGLLVGCVVLVLLMGAAIGRAVLPEHDQTTMTAAVVVGVPLNYAADYFKDGLRAPPRCEDIKELQRPYPWRVVQTTGFYCVAEVVVK